MRSTGIFLIVTLIVLMLLAYFRDPQTLSAGFRNSWTQLLGFLPILVIAILVAGFVEALLPENFVESWLSEAAGWRGIVIAWIAGIITPGGSLIGLPIVAVLYKAGVGISVLMTYATSFALLSIIRIPLEAGFIGWRLAGIRVLLSLFLPLLVGGTTRLLLPLFK